MDIVRLRTMTRLSVFDNWSRNAGFTVQQVIDSGRSAYLGFYYYWYERISFTPDILEELGITGGLIIDKPGRSIDILSKWKKKYYANLDCVTKIKIKTYIDSAKVRAMRRHKAITNKDKRTKKRLKTAQYRVPITSTGKIKK